MRGTDYVQQFIAMFDPRVEPQPAREALILRAFLTGDVPAYMAKDRWRPVPVKGIVDGVMRTLVYRVSPWLEIGDPGLLVQAQPATYQTIADKFHAILPSTKIVRDTFLAADVKIPLQTPGKSVQLPDGKTVGPFVIPSGQGVAPPATDMQTPQAFYAHDLMVKAALAGRSPGDHIVAGHSKNVVIGPNRNANQLAIYGGWVGTTPANPAYVDGYFWQGFPGPHPASWVDYSQCTFLVDRDATLDGLPVDLASIFTDPKLHVLVSTQGPFAPRFPNAGGGGATNVVNLTGGSGAGGTTGPNVAASASSASSSFTWRDAAWAAAIVTGAWVLGAAILSFEVVAAADGREPFR